MAVGRRRRESGGPPTYVTRPSLPPIQEYLQLLQQAWKNRWLTNAGPLVARFEAELARRLSVGYVASTTNATLALQLLYRTALPQGRRVVTTPFTFPATTTALLWEGYRPVFADVDPETFNLDVESVAQRLEEDGAGVVGVHTFGNPAGAVDLARLAGRRGVPCLFDAAHAFGVRLAGRSLLALGDASVLSFHATKNFHTFEGGAVATPLRRLFERLEPLRNFGLQGDGGPPRAPGINAKMTEAQAAMGLVNLRYVDGWIALRRVRYELYRELLAGVSGVDFQRLSPCRYNYIYAPILLANRRRRDRVARDLERAGIHARKYFYPAAHRLSFVPRSERDRCPVAQNLAERVLCLPLYPDLPIATVRRTARIVRASAS